ncbi:allantoicase [Rhodococcus aerolatus]
MTAPGWRLLPDVAGRALGGAVMAADDDFFADVHTLIAAAPPTHDPLLFAPRGKVYDGWETRRRRTPGDDAVLVRLAAPALVHGVVVDTAFFRGNYPPQVSVRTACVLGHPTAADLAGAEWRTVVERADVAGDTANELTVAGEPRLATHVQLVQHPDGGVARLRVHGEVVADPADLGGRVDLAATVHGGRVLDCSNLFYSSPANVLAPGRATVMSDGWETARRRDDGNDWLTIALGVPGVVRRVVVDTSRFVGNAPGWARLTDLDTGAELLPRTALLPDTEQRVLVHHPDPVAAVRLDVYPDGGLSRLRVEGEVTEDARTAHARRWLDLLPDAQAAAVDRTTFFH